MKSNYKRLGNYIQPINIRNKELKVERLLGVSIKKILMPSIANTVGTNMKTYKIIKKNQFAYGSVTSRNGNKISIALLEDFDEAIISQAYTVFEVINKNELNPEYLMMWFRRPEFDRYARFMSHGSARETFDWDEMLEVELPVPSIEKQNEIVKEYNAITSRIQLNEQLNKKLEETAQAIYKHWFVDFEFPSLGGVSAGRGGKKRNTKAYNSLPYNPKLKDRAKALRKARNLAEVLFWQQVHKGKFNGLDFDRQKIIGNYIVDFYCANVNVVVEIDGSSHNNKQDYDAKRDKYLESLGLTVIHITDTDVKNNLGFTMNALNNHPAFQAPLHRRGNLGYKSSGGKMVFNVTLDKEIPEGWKVGNFGQLIDTVNGYAFKSDDFSENGDIAIVKIKNVIPPHIKVNEAQFFNGNLTEKLKRVAIKKNDVLITMTGSGANQMNSAVGQVGKYYGEGILLLNQRVCKLEPKDQFLREYIYQFISNKETHLELLNGSTGSANQANISPDQIKTLKVIIPDNEVLKSYQNLTDVFDDSKRVHSQDSLEQMKSLILSRMSKVEVEEEL